MRFLCRAVLFARSLLGVGLVVVQTVVISFWVIACGTLGWTWGATQGLRTWCRILMAWFWVRVEVRGLQTWPESMGAVCVFNHQSHFDIPVVHTAIDRTLRFGAKIELFKIPFFSGAMRAAGVLPIARDNRNEVFRVYQEAQAKFAKGWSFILAPEGTRQSTPAIGRFKKGPFIFAINAQVPIVPVVIKGSYDILPKAALLPMMDRWSHKVKVHILPPIATKGMTSASAEQLMHTVRDLFEKEFERM